MDHWGSCSIYRLENVFKLLLGCCICTLGQSYQYHPSAENQMEALLKAGYFCRPCPIFP